MNREAWLEKAAAALTKGLFAPKGFDVPKVKVSVGWPSRKATSVVSRTIGQCWHGTSTADEIPQIFVSPVLDDSAEVLATLTHELLHAALPEGTKHGGAFKRGMRELGLEGKPTATNAGPTLGAYLAEVSTKLGAFQHARISPGLAMAKQSTRLIKAECIDCGYTVRVTRKWLEVGAPICPVDETPMQAEVLS